MKTRLTILAAVLTLLAAQIPAYAQESRITLTLKAGSQRAALDSLITVALPAAGLFAGWIDKDYYLVKTEPSELSNLNGTACYYFQIREADGKIVLDVSGCYTVPGTSSGPFRNAGQRGSLVNKAWLDLEATADRIAAEL